MLNLKYSFKALLVAACVAGSAGLAQAQTVLRFSNWVPKTHPLSVGVFEKWGEAVSKATNGRVTVEFISPLGKPPAHFDLVKNGVADLAFSTHSYTADRFRLMEGLELPFMAPDSKTASVAGWRTYKKFFESANEHKGVHLIGTFTHGAGTIFTRDKDVGNLANLKNLKLRVSGGITKNIAETLGGVPFFAPAPKSFEVLSKGVADGILFPSESILNFKLVSMIKHGLKVPGGLYRSSMFIVMNEGKWNALSAEDKAGVDSVSGEFLAKLAGKLWDDQDALGDAAMKEAGANVIMADGPLLQEVQKKLGGIEAAWVEKANKMGVDGKAVLAYYRSQVDALK